MTTDLGKASLRSALSLFNSSLTDVNCLKVISPLPDA